LSSIKQFSLAQFSFFMIFLKIILLPFSFIYYLVTSLRNHLFNIGYSHSFKFEIPVINVGNLRVGGTGKTPHVEYLIRLLKDRYKVATLSRGYGRRIHGFIMADEHSDASKIGDEPMQYYRKFSKDISVTVCEDRAYAIPQILYEKEETQVILLDDAYQHRSVSPGLNILLSDFKNPFYTDWLLPSGRLRESRHGASRADVVIISKCPADLSEDKMQNIIIEVRRYSKESTPVFFTSLKYIEPKAIYDNHILPDSTSNVLLFTGIADSESLREKIASVYQLSKSIDFADHHKYSENDIQSIVLAFNEIKKENKFILTTEKDMVKLMDERIKKALSSYPVFYIPVEVYFLNDKQKFDELVIQAIIDNAASK
jgi:tetraacyldisaccharide 4'-kinase